ncbi:large-conductance mechanosensitive channel protein MscL [Fulvivirgaceae bacterium PWU5]|uniref:Large-conductance mechanosensitive channel n=1 Tax=Dawidia cretensis TaxID=2782350 RepID=A0AAP2GUI1_9BACT|nr:large-conductance mechanosensitive channel protein MscL [Dawidia cretensis]MBT1707577.1 large-conductance mechanosensitive channel protein MscL [Dawidia cretensis]
MLKEFKEFALRGNVIDLAIGVVIGAAFNAIVSSLVADVFMPIIGILTGGLDFSKLGYKFGEAVIAYGKFIQAIFIFIITAFALFLFVKGINALRRKEEKKPADAPAPPPADIQLLTEIRDLLKSQNITKP